MRVYVIGSEGQVARSLREAAARDPSVVLGFSSRYEVDLLLPSTIRNALANFRPDVVINPAAYTAVDKAEAELELAFAINRDGAGAVAEAAEMVGAPVIHFSTDYVFNGRKEGAYLESDPVAPSGVYGISKLQGELAVAAANSRHVIIRTSWVYAPFGSNFVRTMLRLAAERDRLRVVDDQVGCPTYAPDVAVAALSIAAQIAGTGWKAGHRGVTHLAGPIRSHGVALHARSWRCRPGAAGDWCQSIRSRRGIIQRRRRARPILVSRQCSCHLCLAFTFHRWKHHWRAVWIACATAEEGPT